jgi:hypothetical protein
MLLRAPPGRKATYVILGYRSTGESSYINLDPVVIATLEVPKWHEKLARYCRVE